MINYFLAYSVKENYPILWNKKTKEDCMEFQYHIGVLIDSSKDYFIF